jgi:predicted RNase H-like HicB family nuclease/transcriptional regulator with XRE-family HTH domain
MRYDAFVSREGKNFLVEFPDCPGCQTFASSADEVKEMARDALEGWLEAHLVDGQAPPRPTVHKRNPRGSTRLEVPVPASLSAAIALRWARQEQGLSQAQLAQRAKVSQQQIAKLEDPDENPTVGTLSKAAEALGLDVALEMRAVPEFTEPRKLRTGPRARGVTKARSLNAASSARTATGRER